MEEKRWPPSIRLIAAAYRIKPEEVGPKLVEMRTSMTYPQMAAKLKADGAELSASRVAELTLDAQGSDRPERRPRPWRAKDQEVVALP